MPAAKECPPWRTPQKIHRVLTGILHGIPTSAHLQTRRASPATQSRVFLGISQESLPVQAPSSASPIEHAFLQCQPALGMFEGTSAFQARNEHSDLPGVCGDVSAGFVALPGLGV